MRSYLKKIIPFEVGTVCIATDWGETYGDGTPWESHGLSELEEYPIPVKIVSIVTNSTGIESVYIEPVYIVADDRFRFKIGHFGLRVVNKTDLLAYELYKMQKEIDEAL